MIENTYIAKAISKFHTCVQLSGQQPKNNDTYYIYQYDSNLQLCTITVFIHKLATEILHIRELEHIKEKKVFQ